MDGTLIEKHGRRLRACVPKGEKSIWIAPHPMIQAIPAWTFMASGAGT